MYIRENGTQIFSIFTTHDLARGKGLVNHMTFFFLLILFNLFLGTVLSLTAEEEGEEEEGEEGEEEGGEHKSSVPQAGHRRSVTEAEVKNT